MNFHDHASFSQVSQIKEGYDLNVYFYFTIIIKVWFSLTLYIKLGVARRQRFWAPEAKQGNGSISEIDFYKIYKISEYFTS